MIFSHRGHSPSTGRNQNKWTTDFTDNTDNRRRFLSVSSVISVVTCLSAQIRKQEIPMIRGVHSMFYTADAEAMRAFIRDKLGFPYTDVGDGWLIFDVPEGDLGCHPAHEDPGATAGTHAISFYCDKIDETVADLRSRGVEFTEPVTNRGFGLVTHFKMPG